MDFITRKGLRALTQDTMNETELILSGTELLKTASGRIRLIVEILKIDNLSITEIVQAKESAMNEVITRLRQDTSGLATRSLAMFGEDEVAQKLRKQVLPLVRKDLVRLQVIQESDYSE